MERQARAWERNDFDLAVADWLPDGVLVAPAGEWPVAELPQAMADLHSDFTDLRVEIKNVFTSADGSKVAIEWDWSITRKSENPFDLPRQIILN